MSDSRLSDETYHQVLKKLEEVMVKCSGISNRFANIKAPTLKYFYSSVLFTSLCTKLYTLLTILPGNRFARNIIEHWDYASVFCLTRSILECYFVFYYIGIEAIDNEEWDCRLHLLELHHALTTEKLLELSTKDETDETIQELKNRLTKNSYFSSLENWRQKNFLKGERAYLIDKSEIAKRIGIADNEFRQMYDLLSQAVHSLPVSFFQMGKQERGRGVHSNVEEEYTKLCIMWLLHIFERATVEFESMFHDTSE